jgi:hypothetical protein
LGECNEPEYGAFNTLIPRAATVDEEDDIVEECSLTASQAIEKVVNIKKFYVKNVN